MLRVLGHVGFRNSGTMLRCRRGFSGIRLGSLLMDRRRVTRTRGGIYVRLGTTVALTCGGVHAFRTTRMFRKGGVAALPNIAY